jgi:hypothetical protein
LSCVCLNLINNLLDRLVLFVKNSSISLASKHLDDQHADIVESLPGTPLQSPFRLKPPRIQRRVGIRFYLRYSSPIQNWAPNNVHDNSRKKNCARPCIW